MRTRIWTLIATLTIGLSVLTLAERGPAGTLPGCCICNGCPSPGGAPATCQNIDLIGGPANCVDFCAGTNCTNSTIVTTQEGTCLDVPACQAAAGPAAAPAMGAFGISAAALALTAIGLLQVFRRRRQD